VRAIAGTRRRQETEARCLDLRRNLVEQNDRKVAEKSLIAEQWNVFAVAGWRGYQLSGRGILVVNQPAAQDGETPLEWVPVNLPDLPLGEGIVHLAKAYDPEMQVVVLFVRPDGSQGAYTACWHPAPPQAYQAWKRRLL
jgi:hypothetical protein